MYLLLVLMYQYTHALDCAPTLHNMYKFFVQDLNVAIVHLQCDFQNYAILHSDLTRKKIQCNFGATTDLLRTCLRCRRASRRSLFVRWR